MHEMSLTRIVVDTVVKEAGAAEVRTVYLTIGYARDIEEDLFERYFAYTARGTVAEHANLVITRVPFTVRCNQCDWVFYIDNHDESTWKCPVCGEKDYKLNSGMEYLIDSIEIVEADAPQVQAGRPEEPTHIDAPLL